MDSHGFDTATFANLTNPTPGKTPCQNCHERPGTLAWGDALAQTHGFGQLWCEVCVLGAQIDHAEERMRALPGLKARLAVLEATLDGGTGVSQIDDFVPELIQVGDGVWWLQIKAADAAWKRSEFPHPLITLDYGQDDELTRMVFVGSIARALESVAVEAETTIRGLSENQNLHIAEIEAHQAAAERYRENWQYRAKAHDRACEELDELRVALKRVMGFGTGNVLLDDLTTVDVREFARAALAASVETARPAVVTALDHLDHFIASSVGDRAVAFTIREEIARLRDQAMGLG